jgi:hypothetical protein
VTDQGYRPDLVDQLSGRPISRPLIAISQPISAVSDQKKDFLHCCGRRQNRGAGGAKTGRFQATKTRAAPSSSSSPLFSLLSSLLSSPSRPPLSSPDLLSLRSSPAGLLSSPAGLLSSPVEASSSRPLLSPLPWKPAAAAPSSLRSRGSSSRPAAAGLLSRGSQQQPPPPLSSPVEASSSRPLLCSSALLSSQIQQQLCSALVLKIQQASSTSL